MVNETKSTLGKLTVPANFTAWLPAELASAQFTPLPITMSHVSQVEHLLRHHSDLFERLLISQAVHDSLVISQ
jgi:PIN domain nuclease of toxin-antitoxin system